MPAVAAEFRATKGRGMWERRGDCSREVEVRTFGAGCGLITLIGEARAANNVESGRGTWECWVWK